MKKGPERDLYDGEGVDYFQPVTMVSAAELAVIPEVAAVVQPTGLELKSPVMVITAPEDTSLPSFSVATVMVQCSASAPSASVTVCTSLVKGEAPLGN